MKFIHDDDEFQDLVGIVAAERGLARGLVEKDYWVTHTLWALHAQGFDVWFKGGTSLSKGFALIQRFSEDLDLKIDPGRTTLPPPGNWRSDKPGPVAQRSAYFHALVDTLRVPGAELLLDPLGHDARWAGANVRVNYPVREQSSLPASLRPFVLLEVGSARVTPFVACDISSFLHAYLEGRGQLGEFQDNRPRAVRCVHPLVTLLEKLDALEKKVPSERSPAEFVRHFEDAARIAEARSLPALSEYANARALAEDLVANRQTKRLPSSRHPCLLPDESERWSRIRDAYRAIGDMFWGPRLTLEEACAAIRAWIAEHVES